MEIIKPEITQPKVAVIAPGIPAILILQMWKYLQQEALESFVK